MNDSLSFLTFRRSVSFKAAAWAILAAFSLTLARPVSAQSLFPAGLPAPGVMAALSAAVVPPLLKGLKVDLEQPFTFDFILDSGNANLPADQLKEEAGRLIRYFLASLTVPEDELWVNLSPYEANRVIPEAFSVTEMGRDLLAQDYLLKQLTSSLIYPENELGRAFWEAVQTRARAMFGHVDIPMDVLNKVWIIADKVSVYEDASGVFILESRMKVLMEEDYHRQRQDADDSDVGKQQEAQETRTDPSPFAQEQTRVMREIILPVLEKEVNEGENFAQLRQMYHSLILAKWYKDRLSDSLLNRAYAGRNKVNGIDLSSPAVKDEIYQQYVRAFEEGVFDYIREEQDPLSRQVIPRRYFSGGMNIVPSVIESKGGDPAMLTKEKPVGGVFTWIRARMNKTSAGVEPNRISAPPGVESDGHNQLLYPGQIAGPMKVLKRRFGIDIYGLNKEYTTLFFKYLSILPPGSLRDINDVRILSDEIFKKVTGLTRTSMAYHPSLKTIAINSLLQNTPIKRNRVKTLVERVFQIFRKRPFPNSSIKEKAGSFFDLSHELGHDWLYKLSHETNYRLIENFKKAKRFGYISLYAQYGQYYDDFFVLNPFETVDKDGRTRDQWEEDINTPEALAHRMGEGFCEVARVWVKRPEELFGIAQQDPAMRIFVEEVAKMYMFEKGSKKYVRFYRPGIKLTDSIKALSSKYFDVEIDDRNYGYEELSSLRFGRDVDRDKPASSDSSSNKMSHEVKWPDIPRNSDGEPVPFEILGAGLNEKPPAPASLRGEEFLVPVGHVSPGSKSITVDPNKIRDSKQFWDKQLGSVGGEVELEIGSGSGDFLIKRAREIKHGGGNGVISFFELPFANDSRENHARKILLERLSKNPDLPIVGMFADAHKHVKRVFKEHQLSAVYVFFPYPDYQEEDPERFIQVQQFWVDLGSRLAQGGIIHVLTEDEQFAFELISIFKSKLPNFVQKSVTELSNVPDGFPRYYEMNGGYLWAKQYLTFTRLDSVVDETAQDSLLNTKFPGGIDFNPNLLEFERQGPGDPAFFSDTGGGETEFLLIEGLFPVILNMTPVTSLPLLFGAAGAGTAEPDRELARVP